MCLCVCVCVCVSVSLSAPMPVPVPVPVSVYMSVSVCNTKFLFASALAPSIWHPKPFKELFHTATSLCPHTWS